MYPYNNLLYNKEKKGLEMVILHPKGMLIGNAILLN